MAISKELERLGQAAERLNEGADRLNGLLERIDRALGKLAIGVDYFTQRPIGEQTSFDHNGKRVIELSYLGYCKIASNYHLVIKTVKVLESKLAVATEEPGSVVLLLAAPRRSRYAAVDLLPELVSALAEQVQELVAAMDRRQNTAESLLVNLEEIAGMTAEPPSSTGKWQPPPQASDSAGDPSHGPDEAAGRKTRLLGSRG